MNKNKCLKTFKNVGEWADYYFPDDNPCPWEIAIGKVKAPEGEVYTNDRSWFVGYGEEERTDVVQWYKETMIDGQCLCGKCDAS